MAEPTDEEPDWDELVALMRVARSKSRGYASYWEWTPDRRLAEIGVARALAEHLTHSEGRSWASVQPVQDDPPDVLLLSKCGDRVGVEVTELVDGATIERYRYRKKVGAHHAYDCAPWTSDNLASSIVRLVEQKDRKLTGRADQYNEVFVVVFTDEPMVTFELAQQALRKCSARIETIQRAFLLLSYHPAVDKLTFPQGIPVFPVPLHRA